MLLALLLVLGLLLWLLPRGGRDLYTPPILWRAESLRIDMPGGLGLASVPVRYSKPPLYANRPWSGVRDGSTAAG